MRYPIQSEKDREVSDCIMILRPTDRKQHIDVGHTVPQWLKFAVEARSHDSWVFLVSKMFFFRTCPSRIKTSCFVHVYPGWWSQLTGGDGLRALTWLTCYDADGRINVQCRALYRVWYSLMIWYNPLVISEMICLMIKSARDFRYWWLFRHTFESIDLLPWLETVASDWK